MAIEPEYTCPYFQKRDPSRLYTEYRMYDEAGKCLVKMRYDDLIGLEPFLRRSKVFKEIRRWYPAETASSSSTRYEDYVHLFNMKLGCIPCPSNLLWFLPKDVREAYCSGNIKLYFHGGEVHLDGTPAPDNDECGYQWVYRAWPKHPTLGYAEFSFCEHWQVLRGSFARGHKPQEILIANGDNPVKRPGR